MRYHIDTIPLWDAVKLSGECPLCAIKRKNELIEIQRFLGASVMEPDTRIQVNGKGFCTHHASMMFAEKNRLGIALLMHSHLVETEKKLKAILQAAKKAADDGADTPAISRFLGGKGTASMTSLTNAAKELEEVSSSCILCESLKANMARYTYTFLYLWKTDMEFRKTVAESKGMCIPHAGQLLSMAGDTLSHRELPLFIEQLMDLMETNLKRIENDLEWFTLKFDYRNSDKPWNNSRDAVERTINKIDGWCVGEEPYPEK